MGGLISGSLFRSCGGMYADLTLGGLIPGSLFLRCGGMYAELTPGRQKKREHVR